MDKRKVLLFCSIGLMLALAIVTSGMHRVVAQNDTDLVIVIGDTEATAVAENDSCPSGNVLDSNDCGGNTANIATVSAYGSCNIGRHPNGCTVKELTVPEGKIVFLYGWQLFLMDYATSDGCNLVILNPGVYKDIRIIDGGFTAYKLPDQDKLRQLAEYESGIQEIYGCPQKTLENIPSLTPTTSS